MSSYNKMVESGLSPYAARDPLSREKFSPPYSYARREIEVNDGALWRQAIRIIRKHWKACLAFFVLLELALGLLVFSMANTYVARAVLDVEPPGSDTMNLSGQPTANPALAPGYLDTQTEILNSDGLALSVVDQLHLDQNPIFMKPGLMQETVAWFSGLFSSSKGAAPRDTERILNIFHKSMTVCEV